MALMDTRIPLMGQSPDLVNVLAQSTQAAQQQNQLRQQNALAQLYQTQGPGIAAGETEALNALAQLSPEMSLGVQDARQTMEMRNVQMSQMQQQMELARQQARMAAEAQVMQMSAAEAAETAARYQAAIQSASLAETPEQWAMVLQQNGLDPSEYPFENRFMLLAQVSGTKEALDARAAMAPQEPEAASPQSAIAKLEADYRAGLISEDQYMIGLQNLAGSSMALTVGPDGSVQLIQGAGAAAGPQMGSVPSSYEVIVDPETGERSMRMIPNSPADLERQAQEESRERQQTLTTRQLNPTIDEIQTARELADRGIGTTGMFSGLVQNLPFVGQRAVNLSETIKGIESGISLENLNQMRQASPTGGALGNVSDKQSGLLASAFGSLSQRMSRELFLYNLARVENSLNDIVHGEGEGPPRHDMDRLRAELLRGESPPANRFLDELDATIAAESNVPMEAPPGAQPSTPILDRDAFISNPTAVDFARSRGMTPEQLWDSMTPEQRQRLSGAQ